MRITIESTVSEPRFSMKSVIEVPYDDVDFLDMKQLVEQALAGHGYHNRDEDE